MERYKKLFKIHLAALVIESILLAAGWQWILILMGFSYFLLLYCAEKVHKIQEQAFRDELDKKFEEFRKESLEKIGRW
jgi:hypothetical protein